MSESTISVSKITPIGGPVIAPKHERTSTKQTSQRKIEANRRNALHSTGPKTERGKRAVSRNAIKHGLLARGAVITQGRGAENLEEFEKLLVAFREDYQPVGINEELFVERIAICHWRQARVLRCEVGKRGSAWITRPCRTFSKKKTKPIVMWSCSKYCGAAESFTIVTRRIRNIR